MHLLLARVSPLAFREATRERLAFGQPQGPTGWRLDAAASREGAVDLRYLSDVPKTQLL